jgi:L-ascorbate metabolism protein UlaG (beta-lactamase superfamily)
VDDAAPGLAQSLGCTVVGSRGAARQARRAGVQNVVALARGEAIEVGDLTVRAVFADHPLAGDAVGFMVLGSETRYFGGDSRFSPGLMADLASSFVDMALVQAT